MEKINLGVWVGPRYRSTTVRFLQAAIVVPWMQASRNIVWIPGCMAGTGTYSPKNAMNPAGIFNNGGGAHT